MVLRFVADALGKGAVEQETAESLVQSAAEMLQPTVPHITPRLLAYHIWKYQRTQHPSDLASSPPLPLERLILMERTWT
jgi:hypothetical protein